MDKKLKKIIAAAISAAAAASAAIAVSAYLQSKVDQPNRFRIGENSVAVSEVFSSVAEMSMGNTFEKKVMVENTGSTPQFVRVYLDFSDTSVRNKSKIVYTKNSVEQKKTGIALLPICRRTGSISARPIRLTALSAGIFTTRKCLTPVKRLRRSSPVYRLISKTIRPTRTPTG